MSRKFCSFENFGPGPFFSGKIVLPGMIFPEKNGPGLKILFRIQFLIKNANPAALHLFEYLCDHKDVNRFEKLRFS